MAAQQSALIVFASSFERVCNPLQVEQWLTTRQAWVYVISFLCNHMLQLIYSIPWCRYALIVAQQIQIKIPKGLKFYFNHGCIPHGINYVHVYIHKASYQFIPLIYVAILPI